MNKQEANVGVHVEFYAEPVENKRKSAEEGRPIFDDREFVRIRFPGDNKRVHVAPAKDTCGSDPITGHPITYADKYAKHYQAFSEQNDSLVSGTPLSEVPFLTRSRAAELRALSIHNVETLAGVDERNFKNIGMDARNLRDQAQAWMDKADGSSGISKLAAENAEMRDELEKLKAMVMAGANPTLADVEPEPAAIPDVNDPGAEFGSWTKDDLKAYIGDVTGTVPGTRATHPDLVKTAQAALKDKMAAAKAA